MEVTDEMVERACRWQKGEFWTPNKDYHRHKDYYDTARADIRRALEDILSAPTASTTPPPNTRRVRIAVAMDSNNAIGVDTDIDDDIEAAFDNLLGFDYSTRLAIVEADVPLPAVPTVRGRVAE